MFLKEASLLCSKWFRLSLHCYFNLAEVRVAVERSRLAFLLLLSSATSSHHFPCATHMPVAM